MENMAGVTDPGSLPDDGMTPIDGIPINNRFFKEGRVIDTAAAVSKIKCPVLIIQGEEDEVVAPSNAQYLNENLKTENVFK